MALPNPTLTWVMTAEQAVAGTSRQQLIDAVAACITALPAGDQKWTSEVPTGSDATTPGLVINPPATSPILTTFSGIIGVGAASVPAAGLCLDASAAIADGVFAGIGGQYATGTGNDFDTNAAPFGAGVRFSLYAGRVVPAIVAGPLPSSVFAIASEEAIFFGFKVSTTQWYGVYFGAIIEPINLGSAEVGAAATGGERIYGMITSGNSITVSMSASTTLGPITSNNECFGFNGTANAKFAIFDPLAPTTVKRLQMMRTNTTPSAAGMGLAPDGEPFLRAVYTYLDASPYTPYGRMRQLYFYDRGQMRDVLQSAGVPNVDEAFLITGNSGGTPCEALAFGNS